MKENVVTSTIRRILDAHKPNLQYMRPVPGVFGTRELDFHGTAYGYGFVIEAKAPGKKPTSHQIVTLWEAWYAGAASFVITGLQVEYDDLSVWLARCKENPAPDFRFPLRAKPLTPIG